MKPLCKRSLWVLLAALGLLVWLVGAACNLPVAGEAAPTEDPNASVLVSVSVVANQAAQEYTVIVTYNYNPKDTAYRITCQLPDPGGEMHRSGAIPLQAGANFTDFILTIKKPGGYTIDCTDGTARASATFTVEEPVTILESSPQPEATQGGEFRTPKPGDYASAGLWMYFDQGTSSLDGYGVPQQCLPGVNYTQAGGSSHFDIDPAGSISGACQLAYNDGAMRLSGTLTGVWDGTKDEITFHLETVTVFDTAINGKKGTSTNQTVYDGTAHFDSVAQASGSATWSTACSTTDLTVVKCANTGNSSSMTANGSVPFVINFNPQ